MPPDLQDALASAKAAANHVRDGLDDLAQAVASDDGAAIVDAARALVSRHEKVAGRPPDSLHRSEPDRRSE